MILFLAGSTAHLRSSLLRHKLRMGRYESYLFADGERGYRLKEDVRKDSVAIVASVLPDPVSLFDLMALNHLVIENGGRKRALIIPYLGYARQDRLTRPGEGSIGIMVARLLRGLRADKLILFDVHSGTIRKALRPAAVQLSALSLFAHALAGRPPEVIVSPDRGSVSRAKALSRLFNPHPEVATIDKVRPRHNVAVAKRLCGEVQGRSVLIVDDIIDTGGTVREAVKLASEGGARSIRLAATHGIFSGDARSRLSRLPIEEIMVTNTLPQIRSAGARILDIAPLVCDALARAYRLQTGAELPIS